MREIDVGFPKATRYLSFIFIALTVLCTFIMAQEYTADYWLQKGDSFYKNNSYDLALRCYDKAIEINPQEADAWQNRGDILKELGRIKEADAAFAKATELGNRDSTNESDYAYFPPSQMDTTLSTCNRNNLDYMDFGVNSAGDGFKPRIMLKSECENGIARSGTLMLKMYSDSEREDLVVTKTYEVDASDFKTYVNLFGTEMLGWIGKRIAYDEIPTSDRYIYIDAYFTNEADGQTLKDDDFTMK
jgi:tetratricopeptide (TPR) repeat protein